MRRKKIDEIDIGIIRELQLDGRIKLTDLAEKMNLTHPSIYERLKKLIDKEIIKVQANINIAKLKLKAALIQLKMDSVSKLGEMLKKCGSCTKLVLLGMSSGEYNVFIILIGSGFNELKTLIERNFTMPEIGDIKVSYGEILYPTFFPINIGTDCDRILNEICSKCAFYKLKICKGCLSLFESIKSTTII